MTKKPECLQKFMLNDLNCRGELIRLNSSLQTILQQHPYPKVLERKLAECLAASVMLCGSLKFHGQLTLQMQSEGPLKMLVAKCDENLNIKGVARWDEKASEDQMESAFHQGQLIVTIQPADKYEPSQSIISLHHLSLSAALEDYFSQSVQIPTRIEFSYAHKEIVGVLLQLLPENNAHDVRKYPEIGDCHSLLTMDNSEWLQERFPEVNTRLFSPKALQFKCHCSRERSLQAISLLDKQELLEHFQDHPYLVVNCDYCNSEYFFNQGELLND